MVFQLHRLIHIYHKMVPRVLNGTDLVPPLLPAVYTVSQELPIPAIQSSSIIFLLNHHNILWLACYYFYMSLVSIFMYLCTFDGIEVKNAEKKVLPNYTFIKGI
jgi:hypothetical protein